MYHIGDLILYGNTGVCRVTDITKRNMPGEKKKRPYYVLEALYQNCTIFVPVDSRKVFMRPIISKDEAEHLIDKIPSIRAETCDERVLNEPTDHYKALLSTHDCLDLMELSMSIYTKKTLLEQQKRKFGVLDERYMKISEELLFGEFAAALNIPKDKVLEYIAARLNRKRRDN